jgi:hypothetical protein
MTLRSLRLATGLLAAAFAAVLAGCASHAKTLATAAQPASLSVPQTQVTLPPAQPLDPAALPDDAPAPATGAAAKPAPPTPVTPQPAAAPEPARPRRPSPSTPRTANPAQSQTHVETPAEQPQPSVEAPAERPAIQAIVPAEEQKKLRDSAEARKREVRATLNRMSARSLSATDQDLMKRIQFFVVQSDDAEKRGDMSQADAFAQRAQDLARGWQNGR